MTAIAVAALVGLYIMLRDYLFLMLALATGATTSRIGSQAQTLRFTKDGTFQLSVFSDLHYGEAENLVWGPQQDVNSTRVMNTVLSIETPQLTVINGDLITGENTYLSNSTSYVDEIVAPLIQRDLLWASTYGNHDSDFNLSREAIFEREKRYPNSLTQNMVPGRLAGVSNYYLPVFSSDPGKDAPEVILWFFDSRGGNYYQELDNQGNEVSQPDWVDQSVAEWFTDTNLQLTQRYGRAIPSLAFYHIPVNAMLAFQNTGVDPHREPGINDDVPLAQQGQASGQGDVSGNVFNYAGEDIPFMNALLRTKGLMATFSGHDHGDDWCMKWQGKLPGMDLVGNGVDLCFGRHSGYGGYGSWTRGSRQILLREGSVEKEVHTWVRLEDGTVSGSVVLNGTYGQDGYPAVQDTDT